MMVKNEKASLQSLEKQPVLAGMALNSLNYYHDRKDKKIHKKSDLLCIQENLMKRDWSRNYILLMLKRPSAENYTANSVHEGWILDPVFYNDGGFSN